MTARTVALMLVGLTDTPGKSTAFENQVASVDLRWRTRLGSSPALVTFEYGTDDSGYAFLNVPGFRVDGEVSLGAERGWAGLSATWITGSRETYPPWYRHGALSWGWTDQGAPLGNPLGGQARAVLATFRRDAGAVAVDLAAGLVDRGAENLFAPDLEGLGLHASTAIFWDLAGWEVGLAGTADLAGSTAIRWSTTVLRRFSVRGAGG